MRAAGGLSKKAKLLLRIQSPEIKTAGGISAAARQTSGIREWPGIRTAGGG